MQNIIIQDPKMRGRVDVQQDRQAGDEIELMLEENRQNESFAIGLRVEK